MGSFNYVDLFRALFPKWNFFDQVGSHLFLEYRESEAGTWQRIDFTVPRKNMGIFLNAEVNMTLAKIHIIEQFAMNMENESSLKMLQSLLKTATSLSEKVQFRLLAQTEEQNNVLYQSEWLMVDSL